MVEEGWFPCVISERRNMSSGWYSIIPTGVWSYQSPLMTWRLQIFWSPCGFAMPCAYSGASASGHFFCLCDGWSVVFLLSAIPSPCYHAPHVVSNILIDYRAIA